MASSEYLSTKSEGEKDKHPIKAAIYTGIAYVITVVALVMPFILISNVIMALCIMLLMVLLIIALFNYYYSVARGGEFQETVYGDGSAQFQCCRNQFPDRLCIKGYYRHRSVIKKRDALLWHRTNLRSLPTDYL